MGGGFNITWAELMDFYVFDRDALVELTELLRKEEAGD
jgi:hypothetical protein